MSTPNPLIPQGTFQAQAAKSATNVRLAVATIVAIHVVFFGGLLLQGCKRDTPTTLGATGDTNVTETISTNLALGPMDSNTLFYPSASSLPAETPGSATTSTVPPDSGFAAPPPLQTTTPESLWQATNIASAVGTSTETATGPMKQYTVARGDSYSRIAKNNQTTVNALRQANPNIDPLKIKPGDKLNIPAATVGSAPSATGTGVGAASGRPGEVYTVKSGDTLTKIARSHGITVSQLRAANSLKTSRVNVGQKLKIPARTQAAAASTAVPSANPTF